MNPATNEFADAVSADTEYRTRAAIRALLEEHGGKTLPIRLKLSLWLDEEITLYRSNRKDKTP
jgi:hypothetical protein